MADNLPTGQSNEPAKPEQTPANAPQEQPADTTTPAETAPVETAPAEATDTPAAATPPKPPSTIKPMPKKIFFLIGGLFIVGLSALFAFVLSSGTQPKTAATDKLNQKVVKPTLIPEKTSVKSDVDNPEAYTKLFVYGAWSGQTSLIKAVELSTQKTKLLASLPGNIKKVTFLSADKIIYVDQTDKRDHGRQLVIYDLKKQAPQINIPASGGFGVDDYVVSPDKKYVAIWEVSFAPEREVLMGGKSRVYSVELAHPTVKQLLYDETATPDTPVHYPRAILNNGRVFADKFLPNDPKGGTGWAYGLSVVDFDGQNAQDLPQMQAGTYGTQPSLSPDGKYLLFAGYDGSKGSGTTQTNGYRQAIVTPNTVELLETDTLTRKKFAAFENSNTYTSTEWDPTSGKIILTLVSGDPAKTGVYAYDMQTQDLTKLAIPSAKSVTYGFLTQLTPSMAIIGAKDTTPSNLGNLGENYSYPFTQVALYDIASSKVSIVPLEDTFAQYITVLPGNYFNNVLGLQANAQPLPRPTFVNVYEGLNDPKARQQMYTFIVKYDLEATRIAQQSSSFNLTLPSGIAAALPSGITAAGGGNANPDAPKCKDLAVEQCKAKGITESSPDYKDCVKTNKDANKLEKSSGVCSDSPLYLYGVTGTQVDVTIQTAISNANPSYNNGYQVTLAEDGKMEINGSTYESIAYDYVSNLRRVTAPTRGAVVKKAEVGNVLREYARKLGLNQKETADLVTAGRAKATADYIFVSFFDQETSEQILPISFTPEPDNYLNVVFYFKNLAAKPIYTPLLPVFPEPVVRDGFTAVEVSEIVE